MTKRQYCLFGVWTQVRMIIDIIEGDESMWLETMEPPLIAFFMNCLVYELVDPRHSRSMGICNLSIVGRVIEPNAPKLAVKQTSVTDKN